MGRSLRQPADPRPTGKQPGAARNQRDFKRDNKNRPSEASSKRPVPRFREALQVPKSEGRDPRFDGLSGNFVDERFRKQYAFLFDEALPDEKRHLRSTLQKAKGASKRAEVQAQLTRVEQQIREEQARRQRAKLTAELKAKEREEVRAGKRVFHKKRAERRADELRVRFLELKASGRLDKALAKRRRKNAAKDHRYVPSARRTA
ncbi:hypothetical protein WJX81_005833 [Elliptochloris bilobata]|uniref:rRNA biogenesis protein RRP36 n=1 Tax=Elliptochloris bilobata TaxID=381761 RepID=A0AAW1SJR1_9CHLO